MQSCPSCSNELPERAIYCPQCGSQSKCKECGDLLVVEARFCISCGTPVGKVNIEQAESGNARRSQNIIEFSEDTENRRFRAEVSDNAIDSVSQPLALFLGARIAKPTTRGQQQTYYLDEVIVDDIDDIRQPDDDNNLVIEGAKSLPASTDLEVLRRIFRQTSDNKLRLDDSRLKQTNQSDFVKRLGALFLYAHELEGHEAVLRTDLNATLNDAKVYDGNARRWIANSDFIDLDGDSVRLTLPGREYARRILSEYLDPQIETTWFLESKTRRRTSKERANEEKEGEIDEGGTARKGRRSAANSYTSQIRTLFAQDYFAEGRTGQGNRMSYVN